MPFGFLFDIFALIALVFCTIVYAKKGFVKGILSLIGTVIAVIVAYLAAKNLAWLVFDNLIRPALEQRITAELAKQGELTVEALHQALQNAVNFLPDYAIDGIVNSFEYSYSNDAAAFASKMVGDLVAPFVIPTISVILFVLCFSLLRLLLGGVIFLINKVAKLPVLGTANAALGAAMGVFVAGVYIIIAVGLIKGVYLAFDEFGTTSNVFQSSLFYRLFSGVLPF